MWLCLSCGFSTHFYLSLWLSLSFYEALQSCSDPKWATRWCLKEKIWQNLLQSKPAGLTSFRWPVVLIDYNFFLQLLTQRIWVFLPVFEIQPWITSDPVIACVFSKVSWCLGKTYSCEKKYLKTFKTTWCYILIFCKNIFIRRLYDKIVFI